MLLDKHKALTSQMLAQGYVADPDLVSSIYLMQELHKPLLLEGEAGVGKTEVAKCLSGLLGTELIRLQCYEGLDAQNALYEWDYPRQLLAIQMTGDSDRKSMKSSIYSDEYLLKRPLYRAIASEIPTVLLIDEIDRADEEFEALLLEILSDYQISVPEMGVVKARTIPLVILTSNGVRELSDALRRRCLYHYLDYPDETKELNIVQARVPEIDHHLAVQVVSFVQNLRQEVLRKTPGIAETLDWARSLYKLEVTNLDDSLVQLEMSLTSLLKTREDLGFVLANQSTLFQGKPSRLTE